MFFYLLFLLYLPFMGWSNDAPQIAPDPSRIIVNLMNPLYQDGVLSTEEGGVLTTADLRIQAQKIIYTKKTTDNRSICTVYCEGNLLIDYQQWTLVGDSFYYDFTTQTGVLVNGRTGAPPWFFGGKEIAFIEDGSLLLREGFITTSEGEAQEVAMRSSQIRLTPDQMLIATHVTLRVKTLPIFWLPLVTLDLKELERFPFAIRMGWGGFTGSYLSFLYRFLSWREWKATAHVDLFFGKSVGLGINTAYAPAESCSRFFTTNYYAHKIALDDPKRRERYRFQGTYCDKLFGVNLEGTYDFVSDAEMAADYAIKEFNLPTAGGTQLHLRYQERLWIANFFTKVRVNSFQTVNQELPSFQLNWHPLILPGTKIVVENSFKVSYLDYRFSEDVRHGSDFSSARAAIHPFIYRPFHLGPLIATPEAGLIGIAYSNSPHNGGSIGAALGEFGFKLESPFSRCGTHWKHVVEPYLHYHYLTSPTSSPDRHYIFTIEDGLSRLNLMRFGVRNSFFFKGENALIRPLWFDLWANAFFDTRTLPQVVPRAYLNVEWRAHEYLFIGSESAWLFPQQRLDFYNIHADVTLSDHLAFGIEYRYRSPFDWRKADFYNFILDSRRSQEALLASPLSDERTTFLFRLFARLSPSWSTKIELRQGKHKKQKKSYLEYRLELAHVLFEHWNLTFTYEKRQADHRYSLSLLMRPGP